MSRSTRYKQYLRARELGIQLPEATPSFRVGVLSGDTPPPIDVLRPEGFPLSKCYRFDDNADGEESDAANVHLLAALGTFDTPFVPVDIHSGYDGYSWARLPVITKVELTVGKTLHEDYLCSGEMACVESIHITVHTSDGRVFSSPACMAVPMPEEGTFYEQRLLVTADVRGRVSNQDLWYHLGGWGDDGDTYDTQLYQFGEDIQRFWDAMLGPQERLRSAIFTAALEVDSHWDEITLRPDGTVTIRNVNGSKQSFAPPNTAAETVAP